MTQISILEKFLSQVKWASIVNLLPAWYKNSQKYLLNDNIKNYYINWNLLLISVF
jgi:hypothetical protein